MASASLKSIARYCDRTLRIARIHDYPGAVNGLQVENKGKVTGVAAAVDASLATAAMAVSAGANLMIVHHGLFWSQSHPWSGKRYQLIRLLIENDLAVYSAHLPLDAHPTLGNNAILCAALGLRQLRPFFFDHDQHIGFKGSAHLTREQLLDRVARATRNEPRIIPGGPSTCRKIGVVTGGAGSDLRKAAAEGIDTFVTGEGPHWTFAVAEELEINVIYGGHYATEVFGVKALAAQLSRRFNIPWRFLDHPTGL
jgi:dinuclear metal center YbgI/SA1388 family protein